MRSRDLQTWSGPALPAVPMGALNTTGLDRTGNGTKYNPILCPLFDEHNDKQIGPLKLTAEQHDNIAIANDASNSDMDWSDDGRGGVYISYGWSNQESFANMFLAAAEVRNASQQEWLQSFFAEDDNTALERLRVPRLATDDAVTNAIMLFSITSADATSFEWKGPADHCYDDPPMGCQNLGCHGNGDPNAAGSLTLDECKKLCEEDSSSPFKCNGMNVSPARLPNKGGCCLRGGCCLPMLPF